MARRGRRTTNRRRSPKSPRRGRSKRRSPRRGRSKRKSPRRKVRVVSDILSSRYGLQSSNVSGNKQKTMDEFLEGISSESYGIGRMFQEDKKKSTKRRKGRKGRKGRSRKGRKGRRTKSGGFFSWF